MTAAKCNYCSHRTESDSNRRAVVVCPEHAIISGDMDNPNTEISHYWRVKRFRSEGGKKGTNPKLFYIDGDKVSLNPTETNQSADYMVEPGGGRRQIREIRRAENKRVA